MRMRATSIVLCLALFIIALAGACNVMPVNTNPETSGPVEVVSVVGPVEPINPGGPTIQITLKNTSVGIVTGVSAFLHDIYPRLPEATYPQPLPGPAEFNFDVTAANPLLAGKTTTSTLTLIGATLDINKAYALTLNDEYTSGIETGQTTSYQQHVNIIKQAMPTVISNLSNTFADSNNPVRYFFVMPSPQGYPPSIIVTPEMTLHFPPITYTVNSGERLYLIIFPNEKLNPDFSLARYEFYNKDTGQTTAVFFPPEAGPFGPSAIYPLFCYPPELSGDYEMRIYFGDKIAGSQSFIVN